MGPGKKFRFSLESVLKLRRYESERAQLELGRAVQERREQEEEVRRRREYLLALTDQSVPQGKVDPAALQRREAFLQQAQNSYEEACKTLTSLRERESRARAHVQHRHRDLESMHLLRDRERVRHQQAQDKAEMAFLDEQAVQVFQKSTGRGMGA